jgi:NADPH-dependent curcumin reductase CurA
VDHLVDDLGFDAAFDHHDPDMPARLAKAAPDGIDVVFDNVGGPQLEAAIDRLRAGARLALCGMISQYDGAEPYGVRNLYELVTKRATARGFLVTDHFDQMPAFRAEMAAWVRAGQITQRHTVVDGIERVPEVLLGLLRAGGTTMVGKAIVRIQEAS